MARRYTEVCGARHAEWLGDRDCRSGPLTRFSSIELHLAVTMDSFLPNSRIDDEVQFATRQVTALKSQKVLYGDDYVPAEADRPKRARVVTVRLPLSSPGGHRSYVDYLHKVPVALPEAAVAEAPSSSGSTLVCNGNTFCTDSSILRADDITLNLSSFKPPLSYTLSCAPTSTVGALKASLVSSFPGAPPVESQRWVLKGKAMSDGKLLRE
jgi:hypothetical protein